MVNSDDISKWLVGWQKIFTKPIVRLTIVFFICLAVFSYLQPLGRLADPDSFYHTWLTTTSRDNGLLREFPWTQASLYKNIFIDHHFGYHLLLIPFVSLVPDLAGLQLATIFFAALTVTACLWVMQRWRVPWWGVGALLLLTSGPLLFRISLGKAPSLGVGVAIVGYYLICERKLGWLFWWAWFFTWLYSAWPLLLVMAGVYVAVESASDCFKKNKEQSVTDQDAQFPISNSQFLNKSQSANWWVNFKSLEIRNWSLGFLKNFFAPPNNRLFLVIILGYICGLVINPYFPTNLLYLKQLFTMALVAYRKFLGIGAEWYPYDPFELGANLSYPILIWLLATFTGFFTWRKQTNLSRTTWLLSIIFLIYTLRARRQVEYLTPWMIMSSGLMVRDAWERRYSIKKLWLEFKSWLPSWLSGNFILGFLGLYVAILLPWGLVRGMVNPHSGLLYGFTFNHLQSATQWLKDNTPPRSIVFQNDWGTFPLLLYHNNHNYYLTGLDQTFMYEYNHDNYWQWVGVTKGERHDVYNVAYNTFNTSYLLLDKDYLAMLHWVISDDHFRKVYEDREALVFEIKQ